MIDTDRDEFLGQPRCPSQNPTTTSSDEFPEQPRCPSQSRTTTSSDECEYCAINYTKSDVCPVVHSDGYTCTRPKGHDGPHVACRRDDHEWEQWGDSDDDGDGEASTGQDPYSRSQSVLTDRIERVRRASAGPHAYDQ